MPSDLSSYLAQHYLTADPKPSSKKRKRKHAGASSSGLLITDDNDAGWAKGGSGDGTQDGDDDGPAAVAGTSAEFRKKTKSNWKTLGGPPKADDSSAAADAVLAAAAAENAAAQAADDDGPVVEDEAIVGVQKMTDGTHAGLQSAASVTAQLKRRAREERAQFERERKAAGLAGEEEQETIYRDATGRRIDVSMKRAEARRAAAEAEEKERLRKEALKGEVQIEEAKRRREALEDAALMPLARKADDVEMNQELKEQERWNDPMAQFLGGSERDTGSGSKKTGKSGKLRRPMYKGAAPPNRYGIRPGYRWDGVDRGNGFEAERFKAINRRERNKDLSYSWQMDE